MSDLAIAAERSTPWRGAILVFFAALGNFLGLVHTYTIGTFLGPVSRDLGWSSSGVLAAITIVGVCVFLLSPFVGMLVDRVGSRTIGLLGLALFCFALLSLSFVGASIWTWWATSVVVGLAAVVTKPTVWAAGVTIEFDRRRGLALGLALCGAGVAASLWPLIVHFLLTKMDWRETYRVLAVVYALIAIPLFFVMFHPRRAVPREETEWRMVGHRPILSPEVRRYLRSGRFVRMLLASFLITVATPAVVVSFVPIQLAMGAGPDRAAATASLIGIASIVGRLTSGFLLDRVRGTLIGLVTFCIPIAGCLLLIAETGYSPLNASLAAICFGVALGAEIDTIAYLVSRYFGTANFGTIFGFLVGLMMLATGLGPLVLELLKDATGSYTFGLAAIIPIFAVAAVLIASLGPYPDEPETVRAGDVAPVPNVA